MGTGVHNKRRRGKERTVGKKTLGVEQRRCAHLIYRGYLGPGHHLFGDISSSFCYTRPGHAPAFLVLEFRVHSWSYMEERLPTVNQPLWRSLNERLDIIQPPDVLLLLLVVNVVGDEQGQAGVYASLFKVLLQQNLEVFVQVAERGPRVQGPP